MGDSAASAIFRSEALDARGRIDALPSTMHVTNSWTRGTVLALSATIIAATVASVYVMVPIQVTGNGVIIDHSGHLLSSVSATTGGYVEALLVRQGDRVAKGQPLVRLAVPEQAVTIARLRDVVDGFERDARAMETLAALDKKSEAAVHATRLENIDRQIENFDRRIGWLRERETAEAELLKRGISTEVRMIAARIAVQEAVTQRDQQQFERASLKSTALEADARRERETLTRALRIEQAKLDLVAAEKNLAAKNVLVSATAGVVSDIATQIGATVPAGKALIVVTSEAFDEKDGLEGVVFVPMISGKQISPGDAVLMAPASLRENEHDRLRGRVREVSGTVSPKSALLATLGSEQLVELATRQGPVFKVIVDLERNSAATSGFAWTSGSGPEIMLSRGTPVSAKITVEHTPLPSLAIPALRGLFGQTGTGWAGARP